MTLPLEQRLRAVQVAEYLGISRSTLAKWRMRRIGPPYHRCGPRIVYYSKAEVDSWLEACDRNSTDARRSKK
jgi:predicted DNA-binding transcriptional regulator AlpA